MESNSISLEFNKIITAHCRVQFNFLFVIVVLFTIYSKKKTVNIHRHGSFDSEKIVF